MNAFLFVFGIPVAIGLAYAMVRVADEWKAEGRRNTRKQIRSRWREVCRDEFDSSTWTGR